MKKLLLSLCSLATVASAEIGMSPEKCDSAYGKPKYSWERKDFSDGWLPDRQIVQPWQEVRVYITSDRGEIDAYFVGAPAARVCKMIWHKPSGGARAHYTLDLSP